MKKRIISLLLAFAISIILLPREVSAADQALTVIPTDIYYHVESEGLYINWAGVSNTSQFTDEKGRFCFALDGDTEITIYKTDYGRIVEKIIIEKLYKRLGTIVCDSDGSLFLVWGHSNDGFDPNEKTIFVTKHSPSGKLIGTASGNGSEGLASYYPSGFYSRTPFGCGNCDAAINGEVLMINYARGMYNGHQSNGLFAVNTKSMQVKRNFVNYNSHSFDQRVTPYSKTGGFLLESHGDCYPRTFSTAVTNQSSVLANRDTFSFWVEEGAYDRYDMGQINATYARLGNILETRKGAMLVGTGGRSLSEDVKYESYNVFVQVFDPLDGTYVTQGTRSGIAGKNGDTKTTDYGVKWLTELSEKESIKYVQAISVDDNTVAVLFEKYNDYCYDSTWYMILNGDGSVLLEPVSLGKAPLNLDEDPVFSQGRVQWTGNRKNDSTKIDYYLKTTDDVLHPFTERTDSSNLLCIYSLPVGEQTAEDAAGWKAAEFTDIPKDAGYQDAVIWALKNGITNGTGESTFSPMKTVTRSQAVTFLWRANGCPEPNSANSPFTDVQDAGQWYYKAVLWAVEQNITNGTGINTFSPDNPVTCGQMLTFLYRAMGEPGKTGEGAWNFDAERWAAGSKLTEGACAEYSVNAACPRADVVYYLWKAMK